MKIYSKRVWLNKDDSPSTGSVVAYHGPMRWGKGKDNEEIMTILEIADCHGKVRLHLSPMDTMNEFIKKMKLLRNTIDDFIEYLEIRNQKSKHKSNERRIK